MTIIHRRSVMIYGIPQAEFMSTKLNCHIHRYGTPISDDIVVYVSKLILNRNQTFWKLVIVLHRNQEFCNFVLFFASSTPAWKRYK